MSKYEQLDLKTLSYLLLMHALSAPEETCKYCIYFRLFEFQSVQGFKIQSIRIFHVQRKFDSGKFNNIQQH